MLDQRLRRWSALKQYWVIVQCLVGLPHCYADDSLSSLVARKATTQITRYIGPMLIYCLATVCDTGKKYYSILILLFHSNHEYNYNSEYIFFLTLFKYETT